MLRRFNMSAFGLAAASGYSVRSPTISPKWPFSNSDFSRADESADSDFYSGVPRLVTHIDDRCISALSAYYGSVLPAPNSADRPRILDLASSWISHLPDGFTRETAEIIGLGMNEQELKRNQVLSSYLVRDLNENPTLQNIQRIEDGSLDAVVCSVSIDYLTEVRTIMAEIARVLKPGCSAHMAFSNRCFPTKVVRRWLRVSEDERCDQVAQYFAFAGDNTTDEPSSLFDQIEAVTILKPSYSGDPLYCVRARKRPEERL